MLHRTHLRLGALALAAVTAAAVAACSGKSTSTATGAPPTPAHSTPAHPAPVHAHLVPVTLTVPPGDGDAPLNVPRRLMLPQGWTAEVWARAWQPRLEAWTPDGSLLVSLPSSGEVAELTPAAQPSDPPDNQVVLRDLSNPQGLAFDDVDGAEVLYVAESNEVDRYRWVNGQPVDRTVLAADLPDTQPSGDDVHALKEVAVGPDHTVYVDIGSASNATPPGPTHGALPRAAVLAYRPNGTLKRVFATGIRNGDGLAIAPDKTLWTAVNERDDITYPFHRRYGSASDAFGHVIAGYVNDHPPDEVARLTAGRNLGWPFCNPEPDRRPGVAGTALDYADMPFTPDAQTNAGGRRLNCRRLRPIERGLPAHSAPLGFHFLEGSALPKPWVNGALVAAHGSWDREPPRPPVVYWMPWERRGKTLGAAITLVGGFQLPGGARWGRAVDAVPGPDGALYVTDDTAGAIYRIVPAK